MKELCFYVLLFSVGFYSRGFFFEHEVQAANQPFQIVYQDDCYVGDDYTGELISAEKVKDFLIREIK